MAMVHHTLSTGDTVAIIDDEPDEQDRLSDGVEDADFNPNIVDLPYSIDELIREISETSSAAICDLRLTKFKNIPYWGSEVVAKLNQANIPAILVSSGVNERTNAEVRKWRANIPRLITRTEGSDPVSLRAALTLADRELAKKFTPDRKPYQTVVRIAQVEVDHPEPMAEVVVIGWHPDKEVLVPLSVFTDAVGPISTEIKDERFIADVNIYAEDEGDLYFRNIHRSPALPEEWLR
ncbi:hypothetical protein GCM10027598_71630 [Amycolatopsis oliviviridis]|uniref:Response regulator n=1 Tax=Amycolatopsis oliviviridis TaxID=1471590 RepID=A0ABQ3L3A2_9PSEU|nr:hypothetical protein [Amycolatopsis oliviviridis]GHH01527.1 hypothetical protein GCM10017790_01570 [Amycolatopsis oliviviridis]